MTTSSDSSTSSNAAEATVKERLTFGQRLRRLLFRNTAAALVATVVDFVSFNILVRLGLSPPVATAAGCVVGAVVNFVMNRVWTFESQAHPGPQLVRYALVSASGAGLNAYGVKLLMHYAGLDYRIIWLIVRLAVSWGWNLPLQRFFVFAKSKASPRG